MANKKNRWDNIRPAPPSAFSTVVLPFGPKTLVLLLFQTLGPCLLMCPLWLLLPRSLLGGFFFLVAASLLCFFFLLPLLLLLRRRRCRLFLPLFLLPLLLSFLASSGSTLLDHSLPA